MGTKVINYILTRVSRLVAAAAGQSRVSLHRTLNSWIHRLAIGGPSLNMSKSRKRPASALTTPQRPLKRRKPVIDTALQAASRQRPQSLIQAKRSLLLDDAEHVRRQSSVPPQND
ncbi:hypothetical protein C5167_041686 [Papaver somniferum]|nr:hypothetical protein C5167_041686 [Papaver somniferum]